MTVHKIYDIITLAKVNNLIILEGRYITIMEENRPRETMGRLMKVNRLHRSVVEKRFKELGVHRTQHMMLVYISKSESPPSQKQLAEHFDVTPAAIAMSLKKMEKNGLIERTASKGDNRVNVVQLSEKGKSVLDQTRELFKVMDETAIQGISCEEFEILNSALDRMTVNLMGLGAVDDLPKCIKKK